ncbi:hypothetical protein [Mycetocola saprophilus]|uniref:hypothetical protein n=1 Tax=Mycetocola saprophilus TaxID=76636 RepID=UPI0004BEE266|nr:hypothetical protein [Mycetocola saprophilus]
MAASGFGRGWVRVARVEASRVWYASSGRWILVLAVIATIAAVAFPAITGGLIAQDDVVPPDLNLDDANVVGSLYLAGAGFIALPALLWGMIIGDPRAPRRHAKAASTPTAVPAETVAAAQTAAPLSTAILAPTAVAEPTLVPVSAEAPTHSADGQSPTDSALRTSVADSADRSSPAENIRRGSLADSRKLRAAQAERREVKRRDRARLRARSVRISERVSRAADPRAAVVARVAVAAVAGLVLGVVLVGVAVLTSVVALTIFGSSLWLTDDHTLMLGVRMILVSIVLTVAGAGLGALVHGLRPSVLRPILLVLVALAVVGVDAGMRTANAMGALPDAMIRFVPSVITRAASGVAGAGFPPATPFAVSGPRTFALLTVIALLTVAAATTRAAIRSRRTPDDTAPRLAQA